MNKYKCVIANIKSITEESIVIVEASNAATALVINSQERPGTVVKLYHKVDDAGNRIGPDNGID
jgi:hypothetical protein